MALTAVLAALLAAACAYHLLALVLVRQFAAGLRPARRSEAEPPGSGALEAARPRLWPGLSQVKPVRAVDDGLAGRLATFLAQDYPGPHEMLVACAEPDPDLEDVLRAVARGRPRIPVRQVAGAGPGTNRKIAACIPAFAAARHDLVVLSDADMRVAPDYLRAVAQPFGDPEVGLVTCLYAVREARGPGAALEGLAVADFAASVLVARRVEGLSFALGATMAVRREALEEIGGLEALRDYLADDYQLGNRVAAAGWRVVLAPVVVEDVLGPTSLAEAFSHQLRWMRTYRICRPGGHLAFLVTQGTLWASALLASAPLQPLAWAAAGLWLLLRVAVAAAVWRALARSPVAWWALAAPLKDLAYLVLWLLSLGGSRVRWGDTVFRLDREGRMEPS